MSIEPIRSNRLLTNLEVLSKIFKENTDRTYKKVLRSASYYVTAAFAAGFALGVTCGILIQRSLRNSTDLLEEQIRSIQEDVAALRLGSELRNVVKTSIPVTFEAYFEPEEAANDEFYEVRSRRSSISSEEFGTPEASNRGFLSASSTESNFSSRISSRKLPTSPLPDDIANELDELAEIASRRCSSNLSECVDNAGDPASRAFSRCLVYKKQYKMRPDYLWRLARAAYLVSIDRENVANSSPLSNNDALRLSTAGEFIHLGLSVSRRAVNLAETGLHQHCVAKRDAACAYQWLAIFVGLSANASGINEKIKLGYEFKKYVDISINLDSSDAYSHFLKGRWCFEVYNLSWLERQFASRLFADPPSATIDEAIEEFTEAERLRPNFSPGNQIFLAKCEFARSNYAAADFWIDKASLLLHSADPSIGDQLEREKLIAEVALLKPKYSSWNT